ncbi:A disintegrin and metalloproteinase with thrombospondin motifs 6-like [Artemia franciscana]|uniref:A disintegrin and metalloproteinase with thrombospondin motifs 6-like n=1 Tax=Artemia franciscana TaxID=6661 RepID=UPI0032DB986F
MGIGFERKIMIRTCIVLVYVQLVFGDINTEFDHCSLCHGINSTCQIISGIFTQAQLPPGYNQITQIPQGACFVNITALKPGYNHIALRSSRDNVYFLNGYWTINQTGNFDALSTIFHYTRGDTDSLQEMVSARGPLSDSMDIMVGILTIRKLLKPKAQTPLVKLVVMDVKVQPSWLASVLNREKFPPVNFSAKNTSNSWIPVDEAYPGVS